MVLTEAIELANAFSLPGFFSDDVTLTEERRRNEEAIGLLMEAWFEAPAKKEPFSFDLVRTLADRNRSICDAFGASRLRDVAGTNLQRKLPDKDLVHAVAKLQRRRDARVARVAGAGVRDLGIAMAEAPFKGAVMGFDIETTDRNPDRGYVINLGLAFMELTADAIPHEGHAAYFGIPELYREAGVPLSDIHRITWQDLEGKTPFREDRRVQRALLKALTKLPYMAHNAAFEDSWLMLHLDGYAEARKAGKVTIVDSRDICRRIDVDGRSLPRESFPNTLENWARRRGTLRSDEKERHLGLDDVFLMLRTVQAELVLRNML
ncbi:MAG: 3'-5' exonuclease [Acidobacteriota bacterium]|nr:3'-5' exonuclease [Acidobacteriota bacterium]